uniref:Uncharacterized protein n=1 Tax=viral metagenome TaxID=1070528 RepID=A0A6C0IHS4_9ZZZZ
MFENLENNVYYDFVPNKKELEKLEERKKIQESEVKLIDDLFNQNNNNDNNNIDNIATNNKVYDLVSKEQEHKNKQVVQRRKTIIENTNYNNKNINRENEKDK